MSVTLAKDGPPIDGSSARYAAEHDARNGSEVLLSRTFQLFERHARKIGTDWAEAGARLLAGIGQ